MNIGFDIDDTLTDPLLYGYSVDFIERYMEKTGKSFNLKDPNDSWFPNMFDWTKEDIDEFWDKEHENFLMNLPARHFSSRVLEELKNKGHNIFIVTQRYIPDAYEISEKWLTKNNIPFDKLIVNAKDKVEICKRENIEVFIDDRVSTCNSLKQNNINAFVMNIPKNQHEETNCRRVNGFMEFYFRLLGTGIDETNTKQTKKGNSQEI